MRAKPECLDQPNLRMTWQFSFQFFFQLVIPDAYSIKHLHFEEYYFSAIFLNEASKRNCLSRRLHVRKRSTTIYSLYGSSVDLRNFTNSSQFLRARRRYGKERAIFLSYAPFAVSKRASKKFREKSVENFEDLGRVFPL